MEREYVDVDALVSELDQEFTESDSADVPDEQVDETVESTEDVVDEPDNVAEDDETQSVEETPDPVEPEPTPEATPQPAPVVEDPDVHKRNEAFKRLREEADAYKQSDAVLEELAKQNGLTKSELIAKFKEDRLKKQADAQGVPVDFLKKQQELERTVNEVKEQYTREKFNSEAERLVSKYKLSPKEATEVFAKIGALGIDVLNKPELLETAFKAVDYDRALVKGRQEQLAAAKKRRESAPSPSLGTQGRNVNTSANDMDAEIDDDLKRAGIIS